MLDLCSRRPIHRLLVDFESTPEDAIRIIYQFLETAEIGFDERLSLCSSILAHLTSERYQKLTISRGEVPLIAALFVFSYTHNTSTLRNPDFTLPLDLDTQVEETGQEEALSQLRSTLAARMWDLSACPEISQPQTVAADLMRMLRRWLVSARKQMQLCACSMLRNMAASHKMAAEMIENTQVHVSLTCIMIESSDAQLLEEALRLYRNLAIHPDYRILLAENQALDVVTALWSKRPVQIVQYAAARVVRQLLTGEAKNVKRFLTGKQYQHQTPIPYISRLSQLHSASTEHATKMEVGQIVVAIWRTTNKQHPTTEPNSITSDSVIHQAREANSNIAAPVMGLITSSNNASLKTQGWLGLALMAGSKEGSLTVAEVIDDNAGENMAIFQQTLLEQDAEGAPTKDANNACILLSLLKKNHVRDRGSIIPFIHVLTVYV